MKLSYRGIHDEYDASAVEKTENRLFRGITTQFPAPAEVCLPQAVVSLKDRSKSSIGIR